MQPRVQILEVDLQVLPVGLPPHPVHPRRGLWADRPVGRPQTIQVDVVQKRREPRSLIPSCYLAHTIQPAWHVLTGSASGTCRPGRVPLGQPPFVHHLRNHNRDLVRRLRRYYGAV